jgi:hypothetical protein
MAKDAGDGRLDIRLGKPFRFEPARFWSTRTDQGQTGFGQIPITNCTIKKPAIAASGSRFIGTKKRYVTRKSVEDTIRVF